MFQISNSRLSRPLFALALVSLAGCTGSTDPSTANLFDNVRNINSGEYDRQIAGKEAEAAAIVASNQASRTRIASLDRQRAANASTISALRGQIAAINSEIAAARSRVSGDQAKVSQLNALQSQVAAVQSDVSAGGDASVARSELRRIQSAVRALSS